MNGERERPGPKGWVPAPIEVTSRPTALGEVLVATHEAMIKRSGVALSHETWLSIVGERIAAKTRVASLVKGFLTVRVASAAWSTELSFLERDLLARLGQVGLEVRKLRFQVDSEVGAGLKAKMLGRKPFGGGSRPPVSARVELPDDLLARLSLIEDDVLRASIAEAARTTLARSRSPADPAMSGESDTAPRSGQGSRSPRGKSR